MNTGIKDALLTVLVSSRIDPVSGRATPSRADAAAVALAQARHPQGEPVLCTAGAMPESVARAYLAQGTGRIVQLAAPDGSTIDVLEALATACRTSTLVLTGARAESGAASGLLPYALAHRLGHLLIADVIDLQPMTDGSWLLSQALPRGARRQLRLQAGTRAVLVTSARLALREDLPQRHAWDAARRGRIETLAVTTPATPGPRAEPAWQPTPARRQLRALQAERQESGATRMARATGSGTPAASSSTVVRAGSTDDKARVLLEHLRQLALVAP